MTSSGGTDASASTATMEVEEDFFEAKATAFKTPAECKHAKFEDQPLYIKAAPYSPQFEDEEKTFTLKDLQEVIGFLAHIDKGLSNSSLTLHLLIDVYCGGSIKSKDHLRAMWM
jgi:hypothetical protein